CLGQEMEDADDPAADRALVEKDVKRVWDQVARTPNWWMTLLPYEPEQMARLYALTRSAGWEIFFLTKRPASAGDSVQFQTQCWIERYGFYLPSVLTVPGSRGELANALRLDVVIDDLVLNCVEVISASTGKALLLLRNGDEAAKAHALNRGIGVVRTLTEAIDVLEHLHDVMPSRRGRLLRLVDWFSPAKPSEPLPHNPRLVHPLPVERVAGRAANE
ncbi:MAG: hypothetical protein ABJC89_04920, partial [Acidobacteriota bacterium]